MASLSAVRTALAATISAVPDLRVSATYQAQVNPPAAIIMPSPGSIITWEALGDVVNYYFRIAILVTYAEDVSSQAALDAYLDSENPGSVISALHADPTLGGQVAWAVPTSASTYGLIEWAGVQYFGTNLQVTVAAL